MTSLTRVQVIGLEPYDRDRITRVIDGLAGIPFSKVDVRLLESALQSEPEVDRADVRGNIFGRGTVILRYRQPVGKIFGASGLAIAKDGTIYRTRQNLDSMIDVYLPDDTKSPNLILATRFKAGPVAQLCRLASSTLGDRKAQVSFLSNRGLCLNIENCLVVFQHGDGLDRMMEKLRVLMAEDEKCFERNREILLDGPGKAITLEKLTRANSD